MFWFLFLLNELETPDSLCIKLLVLCSFYSLLVLEIMITCCKGTKCARRACANGQTGVCGVFFFTFFLFILLIFDVIILSMLLFSQACGHDSIWQKHKNQKYTFEHNMSLLDLIFRCFLPFLFILHIKVCTAAGSTYISKC